jgi:hypothetical protein
MAAFRLNSKQGKGSLQKNNDHFLILSDEKRGSGLVLRPSATGQGLGDIFGSIANLVSQHGSKIMSGVNAAGQIGLAGKNLFDANKSYKEMNKTSEELEYMKKKRREKEAKKRQQEDEEISAKSKKSIADMAALAAQSDAAKPTPSVGNGLKKY